MISVNQPINITKHFRHRFKQRVANTKKIQEYVENAYLHGKALDLTPSSTFAASLEAKEELYGTTAKIYKNFIYWFDGAVAITIYPVPQKMHGRV